MHSLYQLITHCVLKQPCRESKRAKAEPEAGPRSHKHKAGSSRDDSAEHADKERAAAKSKARDKERERDKEKDKAREMERLREKERARDKEREKAKASEVRRPMAGYGCTFECHFSALPLPKNKTKTKNFPPY